MNSFKSIIILALSICFVLMSCGKDDDSNMSNSENDVITIAELEKQPSFVYSYNSSVNYKNSYTTYIWFRDGVMSVWKEGTTNVNSFYRSYKYSIDGKKLTITTIALLSGDKTTSYFGYITKFDSHSKKQLAIVQGLDGTNLGNLPEDIVHYYDYSSIDFSK